MVKKKSFTRSRKKIYVIIAIQVMVLSSFMSILLNSSFLGKEQALSDDPSKIPTPRTAVTTLWSRLWGGSNSDEGNAIVLDNETNIYITGKTYSASTMNDIMVVKYDIQGSKEWEVIWGGTGYDEGEGIVLDSSNNIYVAGHTASYGAGGYDCVLIKYNSSGNLQWYETWGGSDDDYGYAVAIDSNEDLFLVGYTNSYSAGSYDCVLIKYDTDGNQLWNRTWGGAGGDLFYGVTVESSNIYATGFTASYGASSSDPLLIKYDNAGNLLWNTSWVAGGNNHGQDVAIYGNNEIYVAVRHPLGGQINLLKYNNTGDLQWNAVWNPSGTTFAYGVEVDSRGDVFVTGMVATGNYQVLLIKFNNTGAQQWNWTWGGGGGDFGFGIAIDDNDSLYVVGYYDQGSSNYDAFILRVAEDFMLGTDADYPDIDGDFNLLWETSQDAQIIILFMNILATFLK